MLVEKVICAAERSNVSDPINIQNSREENASSEGLFGILRWCQKKMPKLPKVKNPNRAKSWPLSPKSTKAWTEVSPKMPLRVKNVEYRTSKKESRAKNMAVAGAVFLCFTTIIKWPAATKVSQGTREEFSTGSQAQNPPKLNAS